MKIFYEAGTPQTEGLYFDPKEWVILCKNGKSGGVMQMSSRCREVM